MKILHIIVGLNVGGAELMLKRLIESHRSNPRFQHGVISLTCLGIVGEQLQAEGVQVEVMGMRSFLHVPVTIWRMAQMMRRQRPTIVQTWIYHADLLGGMAARIAGIKHVIWGIRNTLIPQGRASNTHLVIRLCAMLSRTVPEKIVVCAEASREVHAALGYAVEKMVTIPNGYNLSLFCPTTQLRQQMRIGLGFSEEIILIGAVGRFDPLKDFNNFVHAAARVAACRPNVRFIMIGRGVDTSNKQLMYWLENSGFSNRFKVLGERSDVANCMAAMDIFCLASRAEGFPNVVAEAMAMQLPCVVTNVGDAALIVRDTGLVVPAQDATALADALIKMVDYPHAHRKDLGMSARKVVEMNYSINSVSQQYTDLYLSLEP